MAVTKQLVQRMMSLFRGHASVSGTHGAPEKSSGSLKWNIKSTARTLREPPTEKLWTQHLEGERPLGVIPIAEDSTCRWGSIDLDEYDLDLPELVRKTSKAGFPLIPVRSKSNGLHLFLFLREPEAAASVQTILRDTAAALGMARCEIFPKQTRILADRDAGSWIIAPYFGDGDDGTPTDGTFGGKLQRQHGLKPRGGDMTLGEFLSAAEKGLTTVADLATLLEKRAVGDDPKPDKKRVRGRSSCDFSDGPPCMRQLLYGNGSIVSDGRKTLLFNSSTYLKRADPEGWQTRLETVNQRFSPPLPSSEVDGVIQSASKKDYEYQCKQEPLVSYCNSALCRTRKFGVGEQGEFPSINLRKFDTRPPVWFVEIEGKTLELTTEELSSFQRFLVACYDKITKGFRYMRHEAWIALVNEAMENAVVLPAPPELSIEEKFRKTLEEFLTNRSAGQRREDLLRNVPWEDEEKKRYWFSPEGFELFLKNTYGVKDPDKSRTQRFLILKRLGGSRKQLNFANTRSRICWWISSDQVQGLPETDTPDPGVEEV